MVQSARTYHSCSKERNGDDDMLSTTDRNSGWLSCISELAVCIRTHKTFVWYIAAPWISQNTWK